MNFSKGDWVELGKMGTPEYRHAEILMFGNNHGEVLILSGLYGDEWRLTHELRPESREAMLQRTDTSGT